MGPRIHIWSLTGDSVEVSFFAPLPRASNLQAAAVAGWSDATLKGDSILVTFATMDTIFFFDKAGRELGKMPFPSSRFRRVPETNPTNPTPRQRAEWLASFDLVSEIHALRDGTILISYQSLEPTEALGQRWSLLAIPPEGDRVFEVHDAARLRTVLDGGESFIFDDPDSELPGDWVVARLRP